MRMDDEREKKIKKMERGTDLIRLEFMLWICIFVLDSRNRGANKFQ